MNSRDDSSADSLHDDSEFVARIVQYLEGALSQIQVNELEQELAESAAKRDTFLLVCLGETLVREEYHPVHAPSPAEQDLLSVEEEAAALSPTNAMHETMIHPAVHAQASDEPAPMKAPTWVQQRKTVSMRRRFALGGIAAALMLSAVIGTSLLLHREPPETLASISQLAGAEWENGAARAINDSLSKDQTLSLASGCAELNFPGLAKVIIEGPAQIAIESRESIRLTRGKVAVEMAQGMKGFVVHTPDATVTDLGTAFGVSFAPEANATDVHVFKGLVNVAPSTDASNTGGVKVSAGDAAQIINARPPNVIRGGVKPQMFVRDLTQAHGTLELADLISGGDGFSHLRGGIVDQTNGQAGTVQTLSLGGNLRGDDRYHPVAGLPAVDGTFVPGMSGNPIPVDSVGHVFTFPSTNPRSTVKICAGGVLPTLKIGDVIQSVLQGVDYSSAGHSFLFVHPSAAITFDLDAIRRLHPNSQIASFNCVVGNPLNSKISKPSSVFVLINGESRFTREKVDAGEAPLVVNIPLSTNDRFLTLATTHNEADVNGHQIIFGDPTLSLTPSK